jgi:ACS family hexuronate transporter-like MFS transporter
MAVEIGTTRSFFGGIRSADRVTRQRWVVCGLLFLATVIAYLDRGVIAYLEPYLEGIIPGLNSVKYGAILSAFQLAYAVGMFFAGGLADRLGTRKAFALAIGLWSVAAMLPGAAFSVLTLGIAMALLGLGEAALFPVCIKAVAEWFPKRERAAANGMFNSGANVGNITVPLIVPLLVVWFTWRGSFVVAGGLGLIWLAAWLFYYRSPEKHRSVSQAELALILSDPVETVKSVPWAKVFPHKETWAFAIAKFLTDPIWWFYLFWLPRYLQATFHLSLTANRLPVVVVYSISIIGSVGGGLLSSALIKRGKTTNRARKTTMLLCALAVTPVFAAPFVHHLWLVVGLVGVAAAAHQGWSANLFTFPSDVFPKAAVGSVTGVGGMCGALGGVLLQFATGVIVQVTHSYVPLFALACCAYLVALGVLQLMSPRMDAAKME